MRWLKAKKGPQATMADAAADSAAAAWHDRAPQRHADAEPQLVPGPPTDDEMWWAGGSPEHPAVNPAPPVPSTLVEPAATGMPWGGSTPPAGLITSVPGARSPRLTSTGGDALVEDAPRANAARPSPPRVVLRFDDGRSFAVSRTTLIGRDPAVQDGGEELVPVADETRSVSKTHLRLDLRDDAILVTDLHSTNGVAVITSGVATSCTPGTPTLVPVPSSIRFGERELQVVREAAV